MKIIIVITACLLLCACAQKTPPKQQKNYPPPAAEPKLSEPTLTDVQSGMTTKQLIELLGEPQTKTELGFGVSRWYYSDTSFVSIVDDTVSNVVLSVREAEKEILELFD